MMFSLVLAMSNDRAGEMSYLKSSVTFGCQHSINYSMIDISDVPGVGKGCNALTSQKHVGVGNA